jgi:hypothetical protein
VTQMGDRILSQVVAIGVHRGRRPILIHQGMESTINEYQLPGPLLLTKGFLQSSVIYFLSRISIETWGYLRLLLCGGVAEENEKEEGTLWLYAVV